MGQTTFWLSIQVKINLFISLISEYLSFFIISFEVFPSIIFSIPPFFYLQLQNSMKLTDKNPSNEFKNVDNFKFL